MESGSTRECVQCSAYTNSGLRCKRSTCKYPDMCWQHTRQIKRLSIGPSNIRGAGDGLFTMRSIPIGGAITEYGGVDVDADEFGRDDYQSHYGIKLNRHIVRDGKSTQSGLGRYANTCRAANVRANECTGNNARYSIDQRGDKIVTIKNMRNARIPAGSEIFVNYGREFWRKD